MVPEIWSPTDKMFCHYGPFFPLILPYGPRKSKFEKMKKTLEDIIILQMCTINDSHMVYGSWDMECIGQTFFVILDHFFCPFNSLKTQKIKIFDKMKTNTWRYYHYTHVYHKWKSYDVWFLRYKVWQTEFFVILDSFLPFYPSKNLKNQNFEKPKKHLEILSFYTCVP